MLITVGAVAVLVQDVEERSLTVRRVPGWAVEEAIGFSISPILSGFLVMRDVQATHELSPFVQAHETLLTIARAPSRRQQHEQCRQPVGAEKMERWMS